MVRVNFSSLTGGRDGYEGEEGSSSISLEEEEEDVVIDEWGRRWEREDADDDDGALTLWGEWVLLNMLNEGVKE